MVFHKTVLGNFEMALNDTQRSFLQKFLKGGRFSKKSDARKTAEFQAFLDAEARYLELNKRLPSGTDGRDAVMSDHAAAVAYRDTGKFKQAHAAIDRVYAAAQEVEARLLATRDRIIQNCTALTLSDDATQSEQDFFAAARLAVNTALTDARPTPENLALARAELDKAAKIAARSGALKALHDRNPAAAASAHIAFESMRAKTGGGEITLERVNAAEDAAAAARLDVLRLDTELRRAEALPVPNIDAGVARMAAIQDATLAKAEAERVAKEASDLANALVGTQLLGQALATGPLSGKGSMRKMPDDAIKALIAAYEDHPRVADAAVDIANSALDPVAVAKGVATVGAQVAGGFKSADGKAPDGLEPQKYAEDILKMGGTCGTDYFEKLDDYVRLGGLMADAPLPDQPGDTASARGLKRSAAVAGELVDENGVLALNSDEAKMAVGHMMFHPDALEKPTPALNKHALETLEMLGTDPTRTQAATVLAGATPPPPGRGGEKLVQAATGKTGMCSANDTRQAVLTSMLQPVDQGPVGSCFATAPARLLREQDPVEAMRKFTELATKGTFTTTDGTAVAAVTNLPPGEDPLIRSLEYTLATATGREDAMVVQQRIDSQTNDGAFEMQSVLGADLGADAGPKAVAFLTAIRAEFATIYDPMVVTGTVASDGSSSRGGYVLVDSRGNQITTKQQYEDRAVAVALAATGYGADTDEGKAVVASVKGEYMTELSSQRFPPWKMDTGGFLDETIKLMDPTAANTETQCAPALPDEPTTDAEVGARTKEILSGMIGNFAPGQVDEIPVNTLGIHAFSVTPGSDSMQEFLSGPGSTAQKVQDKLVTPGQDLANTDLTVEESQKFFDDLINPYVEELEAESKDKSASRKDRRSAKKRLTNLKKDVAKYRPTELMTPADLNYAVAKAVERAYNWKFFQEKLQEKMVQEMSEPQIVLADTNWGDAESHTFFVVAPDPISGEPMMWEKTDPPGSMRKLGGDWLQTEWAFMQ